jgi:hypothetical protein
MHVKGYMKKLALIWRMMKIRIWPERVASKCTMFFKGRVEKMVSIASYFISLFSVNK